MKLTIDHIEEVDFHWQLKGRAGRYSMTLLMKDEHCGRGVYCEELDVRADTPGQAKKIGQVVLDRDYEPGLKIARVELNY